MTNYLIDMMTWSYSRISAFLSCPYQFYQRYIGLAESSPMFFSESGGLMHRELADFYRGKKNAEEALCDFMIRFQSETAGAAPSKSTIASYFNDGADFLRSLSPLPGRILGVERRMSFEVCGRKFTGIIDLIREDENGALCILDHKSHKLKPRSRRRRPTKTDRELDEYLRQLYLYSIPVIESFGRPPDFLEFNCYRGGTLVREPFDLSVLEATVQWAAESIERISDETEWSPALDFWKCKYLCGFCDQCEYAQEADWTQ